MGPSADVKRLLVARGLRAFGDGYVSLLLPLYLIELGFTALQVGLIATVTLFGSGLLTLAVGLQAYRFHYRTLLLAAAVLMAATGVGFASFTGFWPLLLVALVGTLNPSSGDVSLFLPLEHAVMSRVVDAKNRTATFARYSMVGSLVAAFGSLAAGLPAMLTDSGRFSSIGAMQAMFVFYSLLAVLAALVYRGLPRAIGPESHAPAEPLGKSKKVVYTLAALFSLDAFGGGFVVQSMVALWLYQRFELSLATTGVIFFWTGLLSSLSYLAAVRIADRIGLVNTMVFTHLPANGFLIAAAFMPTAGTAIACLLARMALSQMDVPARQSYVIAVTPPAERAAAVSVTNVPRSLASALSPFAAGVLLEHSHFGWPLVIGGALKIAYDLLLLALFRSVAPREET